jgi:hypothetical protein
LAEVILFRFAERSDELLPSDARGNVADLVTITGAAVPEVVLGLTGFARDFATVADTAMQADDVDDAALLRRDVSVQAILELDLDAQATEGTDGVIVGTRSAWHLRWRVVDLASRRVAFRLGWLTSAAEATVAEGSFYAPVTGAVILTATRRWLSPTNVRVRYYVNETVLSEATSTDGAIDGDAAELVVVGARDDGAAGHELFAKVTLDQVRVTSHELTAEEVRAIYRRMTVHAQMAAQAIRASLPPGKAYSTDEDSIIQRELMVEGDALAIAFALLEELREDAYPERAWSLLEDWERITRLPPKLLDTTETRRARVLGFLQKVQGYNLPAIADALAGVFDLAVGDVELLEYTNVHEDDFATAVAAWWRSRSDEGSIAIAAGAVVLSLDAAADCQWYVGEPTVLEMSIDGDVLDGVDHSLGADVTVKVTATSLDDDCYGGIVAMAGNGDMLWLGYYQEASTAKVGWRLFSGGVLGAVTELEAAAPAVPQWLRLRYDGGTDWTLWYNGTGPDDLSNEEAITGIAEPLWVGLAAFCDAAATPGAATFTFDDWRAFFPNGLRVFNWYAYRDPALAGSPDMPGARAIVAKLKPAETEASAVATEAIECDDAAGLCDDGPLS